MKSLKLLFLLCFLQTSLFAQFPDFTATDIDGNEHSLYEDYLNEGKMVVIKVTAAWGPWDWQFNQTGALDDFYQEAAGTAMVFNIEMDPSTTDDDIRGIGSNTQGDFTANVTYPIINADQGLASLFEVQYYPAVMIICPTGEAFSSYGGSNFTAIDNMEWNQFLETETIFQKGIDVCNWSPSGQFIVGDVYRDDNANCTNDAEAGVPNTYFEVSNGSHTFHRFSNSDGVFKIPAQAGNTYSIQGQVPSGVWEFCDDYEEIPFDGTQDSVYTTFALQPLTDCPIPQVDISSPLLWRCFESRVYVKVCNAGTVALEDGQVTVNLDPFLEPVSFSIPPVSSNGTNHTFDVSLGAMECVDIVIDVLVSCDVDLGYEHCYSANVTGSNICSNSPGMIETDRECRENQGSFDPNDKRNFPAGDGEEHFVKENTDIEYHIRFQNTGTFMALNVVIKDTLSDVFDISTLRLGASSHPYELEITDDRTLNFIFNDIMLPDSTTDLAGSQGFVSFHLSQVPDLPDGTLLENDAAIYFDFNEPIITNKTLLTIGELSNANERLNNLPFSVQPNPATDQIQISVLDGNWTSGTVRLYHISGQLMATQILNATNADMDVSNLAAGVYLLHLANANGQKGVQKVVVK